MYLIPTGDGNNSILIAEMNSNFAQLMTETDNNICKAFVEEYANFEHVNKLNSNKNIWIPCFQSKSYSSFHHPHLMHDVLIKNQDEICCKISHLDEIININSNPDIDYNQSFLIFPNNDEIVIKKDFLMAFINLDVLSELNIPAVFVAVIEQNQWIN